MFKFVVLSALVAIASAHIIAPAAPILTKTVHYESEPIITGHTETILKPKLEIPIVKTAIISEPTHIEVHEPTVARVGEYVESVPTAVSHQSSTVVHSRAKIVTPILAPAVKTHIAPIVKTYSAPVLTAPHPAPAAIYEEAPILKTYEEAPILKTYETHAPILKPIEEAPILKTLEAAPIFNTIAAPSPILNTYETAPIFKTYETAPIYKTYAAAAPLHYSAPVLSKTVHYDAQPIVTGYSETILKPKLDGGIFSAEPAFAYAARPELHYAAPLALEKEIHEEPIVREEILKPKLETVEENFPYPAASAPAW